MGALKGLCNEHYTIVSAVAPAHGGDIETGLLAVYPSRRNDKGKVAQGLHLSGSGKRRETDEDKEKPEKLNR